VEGGPPFLAMRSARRWSAAAFFRRLRSRRLCCGVFVRSSEFGCRFGKRGDGDGESVGVVAVGDEADLVSSPLLVR